MAAGRQQMRTLKHMPPTWNHHACFSQLCHVVLCCCSAAPDRLPKHHGEWYCRILPKIQDGWMAKHLILVIVETNTK